MTHKKGMRILNLILLTIAFTSCSVNDQAATNNSNKLDSNDRSISAKSVLTRDEEFINKQILKERYTVNVDQYLNEKCLPAIVLKSDLIESFEGYENIGDIDNDSIDDFVFVLEPLDKCEEGKSYYFSNTSIPRIYTDSGCCHPYSIFSIGDIDEDGSNEIAQYYSSCSSRYKRINVWTLKNSHWLEVAEFAFTLNADYEAFEDFDKLYEKVSKGVFKFLDISDVNIHGETISEWKTIVMK